MMSFRPIADVWILARPKVKYYGAYPNGFLERALPLLGASDHDEVLHVCGGKVRDYPNKRCVQHAWTLDADPSLKPDFLLDVVTGKSPAGVEPEAGFNMHRPLVTSWRAVLCDPPYTPEDHEHYAVAKAGRQLPTANEVLRFGLQFAKVGGRVGVLHYQWPQPPKTARSIAVAAVLTGFNNRVRVFSVFERVE